MSHHIPDPNKSVNLIIDGKSITVPEGTKILDAARKANAFIPTLCDRPGLCRRAVCRICVVECDGKGKLLAACANDVWEGVNIVTNNSRIINIRKTIIEMLLADHPRECLTCPANTDCKLQSLAQIYGIRETPFAGGTVKRQAISKDKALLRDMDKCVKCGRCVEACQTVQTVRAINSSGRSANYRITTAYNQPYENSPCVFCGHCRTVCPVGAIYENDQSAEVWDALNDAERKTAVQFSRTLCLEMDNVLGFPKGTASPGKTVTALKRLGFDLIYDAQSAENIAATELAGELRNRVKNGGKPLPIINCCSKSAVKFIENFYPDLTPRLSPCASAREIFADMVKKGKTTAVSIEPCVSGKRGQNSGKEPDITLTVKELAGMIKLAGIDFVSLPESPFEQINTGHSEPETGFKGGKCLIANGLGKAREILDSIRKDECDAALVEIKCCPLEDSPRCSSICS